MRTTRESTAQIAEETSSTFSRTRVSSSSLPRSPFSAVSRLVPMSSRGLRYSKAGINGEPLGDDRVGSTYETQILTKLYDNRTLPSVHSHVLKHGNRRFPKPRPKLILLHQIKNSRVESRRAAPRRAVPSPQLYLWASSPATSALVLRRRRSLEIILDAVGSGSPRLTG